ncbi:hypothetical protein M1N58_00105 [Dehalococcoidales bacterium]|nr:hypothetical protein [Dehalococcoidales bacterium]
MEWQDFTVAHRKIREEIERKIAAFLKGENPTPLAIRGPIGQGKTQLEYHAFKVAWDSGGVAFYATLDQLLPEKEMAASSFAEHIDNLIDQCRRKLDSGALDQIPFLTKEMRIYVQRLGKNASGRSKTVLLIDEMERHYKKLLETVKTDDRSPFGYWLEHTNHFPIAAFAPLSHYEVLYGEAERRRWDTVAIPTITPSVLRERERELGNFIWWISRGRLGISYKAMDVIKRGNLAKFKDFEELARTLGSIAEVPAIDLDTLAKLSNSLDFVVKLFPQTLTSSPYLIDGSIVARTQCIEQLKDSLKGEGWHDREVEFFTHYFDIIADGVSHNGNFLVPNNHEEFKVLFKLAVDLAIESETSENEDVRRIADKFKELEEGQRFALLFYTKIFSRLQEISKGKGWVLSYREVANLFPMPIVSPVFGGIDPEKGREILLSKSTYYYVSKDELVTSKGTLTFLYFLNETKLRDYLNSSELISFLPPHKGLVCVLIGGDPAQVKLDGVASWLEDVNRLTVDAPPKILCDFLTCFSAWVFDKGLTDGYISDLRETLESQAEELWAKDKELSTRVSHYLRMLKTFLSLFTEALDLDKEKYWAKVSQDSTRIYGSRFRRFPEVVGLAFVGSKDERDLVYRLRKLLQDSNELKGLRSGISGMLEDASVTRTGLSGALSNIRSDFDERKLASLRALAHLKQVQEDEFRELSEQNEGKIALSGIYKFVRSDVSPSAIGDVRKEIGSIVAEIEKLRQERGKIAQLLGINLRESISEKNENQFKELDRILADASNASPYVRSILVEFAKTIADEFKNQYLHPDQTTLSKWQRKVNMAQSFGQRRELVSKLRKEVFEWLDKNRNGVLSELQNGYSKARQRLTRYEQQVDWDNVDGLEWAAHEEETEKLSGLIGGLSELDSELEKALELANEVNTRLKKVGKHGSQ